MISTDETIGTTKTEITEMIWTDGMTVTTSTDETTDVTSTETSTDGQRSP